MLVCIAVHRFENSKLDARAVGADTAGLRHAAAHRGPGHAHAPLVYRRHAALLVLSNAFLAAPARARLTHLALPHFVDVPSTAAPRRAQWQPWSHSRPRSWLRDAAQRRYTIQRPSPRGVILARQAAC